MENKRGRAVLVSLAALCVILGIALAAALIISDKDRISYLQNPQEIYTMESGILYTLKDFRAGNDYSFAYDMDSSQYRVLAEKYNLKEIASKKTQFDMACALMNEFSGRLRHHSNYDNSVEMEALKLLEYSLDNRKQGINCRSKAQILNEMCLALGIYSRKVWINPNSRYDTECHVVNEIWDEKLSKWVMLDITNNTYWVDENAVPLSILEIRDCLLNQSFCTPVYPDDKLDKLSDSLQKNYDNFIYIAKNMAYFYYCDEYSQGEGNTFYYLLPQAISIDDESVLISKEVVERAPY